MPRQIKRLGIGDVLARARKHANLSQAAVARECGLSKGELSQIERGVRTDPRFTTVARLADIVGLSLDQLAHEIGHRQRHRAVTQDLLVSEAVRAKDLILRGLSSYEDFRKAAELLSAGEARSKRKS